MERAEWLKEVRKKAEALYDQCSPLYWVEWGKDENQTHQVFMRKFLERLEPGGRILSAACGAGRYDGCLLEGGHSVLGIDQSGGMLRIARKHFPQELFPQLRYAKIGLQEMDFHSDFAGVTCMDAMEHIFPEDYLAILRSFWGALKPGGWLYFTADREEEPDFDLDVSYERARALGLPVVYGEVAPEIDQAFERVMEQPELIRELADAAVYHYYPPLRQVKEWIGLAGFLIEEEGEGSGFTHFLAYKPNQQ